VDSIVDKLRLKEFPQDARNMWMKCAPLPTRYYVTRLKRP
jgi:hypothetical protein